MQGRETRCVVLRGPVRKIPQANCRATKFVISRCNYEVASAICCLVVRIDWKRTECLLLKRRAKFLCEGKHERRLVITRTQRALEPNANAVGGILLLVQSRKTHGTCSRCVDRFRVLVLDLRLGPS